MTIILNLLSFLNINGFMTSTRVAYINPDTQNLIELPPEGQNEDVLMEPAQQLAPQSPIAIDPNADPAVGITAEQYTGSTPTPHIPFYETPIFIGAIIFCVLLAGLIVYFKKRK
jgi:hypothetical protein